jgi:hypothetical protein
MKLALDNKDLSDDFFEGCRLLGIMSELKDYRFCREVNIAMGTDFRINNEIEIQLTRKRRNYFFAVYEYHEPVSSLEHYIYNNRFDGEYLLPEFRHLDFLWLMKGDTVTDESLRQKAENIRAISGVQLVVELTNEKIRNKEHLVF